MHRDWMRRNHRTVFVRQQPVVLVTVSPDRNNYTKLSSVISQLLNNINNGCLITNKTFNENLLIQAIETVALIQDTNAKNSLQAQFSDLANKMNDDCSEDNMLNQRQMLLNLRSEVYYYYSQNTPAGNLVTPYNFYVRRFLL